MKTYKALQVSTVDGEYSAETEVLDAVNPKVDEIVVRVHFSALNRQDLICLQDRTHETSVTSGIDCAGVVMQSMSDRFVLGDEVIITGFGLGSEVNGGFSQLVCVPAKWAVLRPANLSLVETMALGSAGLTAAMAVDCLIQVGITPGFGRILVTGASGGVGSIALMLLSKLGYQVDAATRKSASETHCLAVGASAVFPSQGLLVDPSLPVDMGLSNDQLLAQAVEQPLVVVNSPNSDNKALKPCWGAVIDTLGGDYLSKVLQSTLYGGTVIACGQICGDTFSSSIDPFIKNGINLMGVDALNLPIDIRQSIWNTLSSSWHLSNLDTIVQKIELDEVPLYLGKMKRGELIGRVVVSLV